MLKVISINELEKWNAIVKSFSNYDVYYLSEYVKALKLHGDGEPMLFYFEDESLRAINVVMKRDIEHNFYFRGEIPKNSYFDISTPYGYGGFLVEGKRNNIKHLFSEYSTYCKCNGIVSEFVRFHPMLNNNEDMINFYEVINLGKTVSIDLNSKEYFWMNYSSKNRNKIRKAKKLGVEIFCGRSPKLFDEFVYLYTSTMDRDNAKEYYYFGQDFYNSILYDLKRNSLIFYAAVKNKIISMSIILFANQKMHYHLSASDKGCLSYAPTNLLLYEVACWGSNNGYKTLHLGGGLGSKEDSLYTFKKSFNKNFDNHFFVGKRIFINEIYDKLVKIREKESEFNINTSFFPKYRN